MYKELLKWENMGESSSRGVKCSEELPVVLPSVSLVLVLTPSHPSGGLW